MSLLPNPCATPPLLVLLALTPPRSLPGSHYWTFKLIPFFGGPLNNGLDYSQYSAITLWTNTTTFPTVASAGLANATTPANAVTFLDSRARPLPLL